MIHREGYVRFEEMFAVGKYSLRAFIRACMKNSDSFTVKKVIISEKIKGRNDKPKRCPGTQHFASDWDVTLTSYIKLSA